MMARTAVMSVVLIVSGTLIAASPSFAAAKKKTIEKPDPAVGAVDSVLRSEVAGQVDRRERLASTLEQNPDSVSARWQAGFVRAGNQWRSFDEILPSTAESNVLKEYRAHRQETAQTSSAQLDLANWCKKAGLKDQERAHLLVAVSLAPGQEQPAIRQRLGYMQIGTQWVSEEEVHDWKVAIRQSDASLKKWSSRLERMAQRLDGNKSQREAALAELRSIADASMIPAIELVLAGRDGEPARAAVEAFRHIDGPDASLALAKQAVFSTSQEVRKSASRALRDRKLEDFVPALIGLLATPGSGEYRVLYDSARGALLHSYLMATEMENQFQVTALDIASQVVLVVSGFTRGPTRLADDDPAALRQNLDSSRRASDILFQREQQRETEKVRILDLNGRVIAVLAEVSGADATPDARQWWQWWYDYTDSPPAGTKPVVVVYEEEYSTPTVIPYLVHRSCFAAGTPVWTDSGLVPIETIQVGDRVLAKDIKSGELTYKPVLLTTVNPPKELITLRFDNESIVGTKGHRFWNSGSGWTKARDLTPQTLLHTATGNTPIWSAKPGPVQNTYNLIVADFHTYFVGKVGVLCEDLRRARPADTIVPGLNRANAVTPTRK
jgi:hypothetical protein